MTDDARGGPTEVRTFLIADIRGYTSFTETHGDEAGARLAARFAEVVREQVEAHAGVVVELRGDEALCAFGSPRGALRSAVELQRRCADEIRTAPELPLRLGIGIDAGEAVPVEGGFRGGALNLAARLCALAGPGEVLVSEGIVHLARRMDGMTYVDRGRMRLKGLEDPVQVMQVEFGLDLPVVGPVRPRTGWTQPRVAAFAVVLIALTAAVVALAATRLNNHSDVVLAANAVGVLDASGRVSGQVTLPGGRPGGIAAGSGAVWATDAGRNAVVEIQPDSHRIVDTVPDVGREPTGVAVGGGGVWVADSGGASVLWLNAAAPGAPTPIQVGQGPGPIVYGLGAAWVANTVDGTLQRIDGARRAPSPPVTIGTSPAAIAVGDGSVWVTDTGSNSVVRVDPQSLEVTDRLEVGNDPVALAFGGGRLWVANGADGTVTSIDPSSDTPRTAAVGGRPIGIAYVDGAVWVATDHPDGVVRVDPANLSARFTDLASPPQAIVAVDGHPWITALSSPASHRGGTLRVVVGRLNGGYPFDRGLHPFDPGAAPYPVHFSVLHLTNDGLVALRHVGGAAGGQVVPDLALTLPAVTDGGRTYTFRLRRGIRYSNGDLVRPSDFRFAVVRQFLTPISYGTSFFTNIRGAAVCARSTHRCPAALASGIQPNDSTGTLTIHLVNPDPGFLYELATTFADLLPPDSPPLDSGRPVPATGPYMISDIASHGVTLVRNPRFREWSADAQPAGFPDRMVWTVVRDAGRELTEVERGRGDAMLDTPPAGRRDELRTTYSALAHPYVQLATTYMAFNTTVPPFSSPAARRAVNFAIDRRRVAHIRSAVQSETPTCQILPPTMFGYTPYCPYTAHPNAASGAWHAPDPARADALVRSSGTRGDHVALWGCSCLGAPPAETRYVGHLLKRLGYRTDTHVTASFDAYVAGTSETHSPVAIIEGWVSDFPYPSNFFDPLLMCSSPGPEPATSFCDPKLDRLVRSAKEAQGTAAVTLWQAADRDAVDQAAWAPLTNELGVDVIGAGVGNYQHNPQTGVLLDQLWVR